VIAVLSGGVGAARLLAGLPGAADARAALAGIAYASMAIVTLAYPAACFPRPLEGSGYLVPAVDGKPLPVGGRSHDPDAGPRDAQDLGEVFH